MTTRTRVALLSLLGVLVVGMFGELTLPVRTTMVTAFGTPVARMEGVFGMVWNEVRLGGIFSRQEGLMRAEQQGRELTTALVQSEDALVAQSTAREHEASGAGVVVSVIRRSFTALEQSLVIATPPEAHEDMSVYAEGALIGRVTSVVQGKGVVALLWSPGNTVHALLARSGTPVELEGQGAGFWLARVPRSQKVEVGEVVVMSHASRDVVGAVRAVRPESASPFTEFVVRSSVNPTMVQFVTLKSYVE